MGKRKDNKGKRRKGIWILGIISEQERGRIVLEVIEGRDHESIVPLIEKHVGKGRTIKTDRLKSYERHKDLGYEHVVVNHSVGLICPWTGVNTNLIEGSWFHFKDSLPKSGLHSHKKCYAGYLYQFAYQRLVRYQYPKADKFLVFLRLWGEVMKQGSADE